MESLVFETGNVEIGEGLGYRWQSEDQRTGFDVIVFHYKRELAQEADLYGTFYNGDIDLLDGAFGTGSLPITSDNKEEFGARVYGELGGLAGTVQFTPGELGIQRAVKGAFDPGWLLNPAKVFPLEGNPAFSTPAPAPLSHPAAAE